MQNYGQHQTGYQRPGSTTGFATAPAVPPPYGAPQGYQTASPQSQSQWAPPAQGQTPVQQQWNQPQQQQQAGGYNPGVYGAMPGGYSQSQQAPAHTSTAYPSQEDVPPPPPPKPAAFAPQQQNAQSWGHQVGYGAQQPQQSYQAPQQNLGHTTQGQPGEYAQQNGYYTHATASQSYSSSAPPPLSQTPAGSYFPPSQTPQAGGRPGSIYGADLAGASATPSSAVAQQPSNSILSPNEQNPAYIPPSLTGQGVQSYVPSNTNPMPGVYVPPPPDIPAWQQASHAPLQGGKKFKYTRPAPDPNTYGQGVPQIPAQGQYGQQSAHQPQQYGQNQYPPAGQATPLAQYGQPVQNHSLHGMPQQQGQHGAHAQPQQTQYGQPNQPTQFAGQPAPPYSHPQDQPSLAQPYQQQPQHQWQPTPPTEQGYPQQQANAQAVYGGQQQQTWQPQHQAQGSLAGQGNQTPTPTTGQAGTIPLGYFNEPSPQSQPVSPIQNRFSISFDSGQAGLGRTGSVSSIALGAIHAQRAGNRTESPNPPPPKLPTPPPPRDDATKFSALGTGGPSDWEHFGATEEIDDEELFAPKKDGRQGVPVQLDSVEVPSQQVSPPQTQGEWPTPPVQPAAIVPSNRDTYQPTPPPNTVAHRPPSQPQQQNFVMGDATPSQLPQQSFVMGDTETAPYPQQQPQQSFVMDDAIVAPLRISRPSSQRNTPAQQLSRHQAPPTANSSFIMSEATPVGLHTNAAHAAELKAKDDASERLRIDAEKERANLQKEVEQLKIVIESTRTHAEYERNVLTEQIETMKVAAEQAKNNSDALIKDKDSTVERLKEDGEGKEDTIREKDAEITRLRDELRAKEDTIAKGHSFVDSLNEQLEVKEAEISNLKQQIENNQTAERLANDLRQQLEEEKSKEPPKPTPAGLVPDLDPWYAGSLERYIAMLRSEAHEIAVEDKIKVFTAFLKAESSARGLDYHSAPPSASIAQQQEIIQPTPLPQTDLSARKKELNVRVPSAEQPPEADDIQYSPGGRPIVLRKTTLKSEEFGHPQQTFSVSSQSTTVLTPTSSQGDTLNKTPTPVQSPPAEPPVQSQYKAYVPPNTDPTDSTQNLHRQSVSTASPSILNPASSYVSKKDEVFFGASPGSASPSTRPNTGSNVTPDATVPAPLFAQHPPALATKSAPKGNVVKNLTKLLPVKVGMPLPNLHIGTIRTKLAEIPTDQPSLPELTVSWEKSASLARKKNDGARRKRQEESEAQTDQLFNDHEIAYADIGVIEDEFKERERELKADEDRDEYHSYVQSVFDKVYIGLQEQIQQLTDLYNEAERLLSTAVSGVKSFEGSDAPITEDCLKLLQDTFEATELRHEKVVEALAERDKRFKKTEIQPLYAAGNIAKMKQAEKHFLKAEKDAALKARDEKAVRAEDFIRMVEAAVVSAIGVEQHEIQEILAATRDLPSSPDNEKLVARAKETVLALSDSSKSILQLLNDIEIDIGGSLLEAQLAEAQMEKQTEKAAALEKQISDREQELKEEFKRKMAVLDQDRDLIDEVVREKSTQVTEGSGVELSEEEMKKERLSKALEEAKRRNGDL